LIFLCLLIIPSIIIVTTRIMTKNESITMVYKVVPSSKSSIPSYPAYSSRSFYFSNSLMFEKIVMWISTSSFL
jgi:uncharacterized membrane protein (GlpM family)